MQGSPVNMPYDESTNTHAMCKYYDHAWKKHTGLTARQKSGYEVQVCRRKGCDAARRVYRPGAGNIR